jgi:transposase-like protein
MQSKAPVRRNTTVVERARILEACADSELTRTEFAAQYGIGVSTLYQWLRQREARSPKRSAGLVEVPNLFGRGSGAATPAAYRLHLPGGRVLEVAGGFDAGEVRLLVQLVQSL